MPKAAFSRQNSEVPVHQFDGQMAEQQSLVAEEGLLNSPGGLKRSRRKIAARSHGMSTLMAKPARRTWNELNKTAELFQGEEASSSVKRRIIETLPSRQAQPDHEIGEEIDLRKPRVKIGPGTRRDRIGKANLASQLYTQGQISEAEELEREVLALSKNELGSGNLRTVSSMARLARIYCAQGRLKDAEEMEVQVISIQKEKLGDRHIDTLYSRGNLASNYKGQRRFFEAKILYREVLEGLEATVGRQHPFTVMTIWSLRALLMEVGEFEQLRELYKQLLPQHSETLSRLDTFESLNDYFKGQTQVIEAQGRRPLAESTMELANIPPNQGGRKDIQNLENAAEMPDTTVAKFLPGERWELSSGIEPSFPFITLSESSGDSAGKRLETLAREEFVRLLLENETLGKIYQTAFQDSKIDPTRFEKALRHFLDQYSVDLKTEPISAAQNSAVSLVRSQSKYAANRVQNAVFQVNDGGFNLEQPQKMQNQKDQDSDFAKRVPLEGRRPLGDSQQASSEGSNFQQEPRRTNSDSELDDLDDMAEPQEGGEFSTLSETREFMVSSNAFFKLQENLWHFAHQTLRTRMRRIVRKLSEPGCENPLLETSRARLNSLIRELDFISPNQIWISDQNINSFSNTFKEIIENRTGETWDWWPLSPRVRALSPGQARLHWHCVSCPIFGIEVLTQSY